MAIEPIGNIDARHTSLLALEQMYHFDPAERRPAAREQDDLSVLTVGDHEFLNAVFGSQITSREDLADVQAEDRPLVNEFLTDLIRDRQNGNLPIGTEVTASYVRARFDAHVDLNGTVHNPLTNRLTPQNLADAETYFNDRVQGAAIDLQA
jgi:hypothetical protein